MSSKTDSTKSKQLSILIVDDEDFVQELLGEYFKKLGYQVYSATDSSTAVELVSKYDFPIALVDLRSAEEDGIDLLDQLKKIKPTLRVVLVSGYPTMDSVVEALRHGAFDFVAKPFCLDELAGIVKRANCLSPDEKVIKALKERVSRLENVLEQNDIEIPVLENLHNGMHELLKDLKETKETEQTEVL
jgi:DNA-binding NtrC family response regulator